MQNRQGIAYKINGEPRLTWPAVTIDEETGAETTNLADLIAALPEGVAYELVTEAEAEAWWAANQPAPGPEDLQKRFTDTIQGHLDAFARTRNYDGILSAATYATSTVDRFLAEGQYAVEARDAVWAKGYEILAEVAGGARPLPTVEEVIAELPGLAWPE